MPQLFCRSAMGVPSRSTGAVLAESQADPNLAESNTEPAPSTLRGGPMRAVSQFVPANDDVTGALQSGPKRVVMRAPAPEAKDKDVKVFPPKSALRVPQARVKSAVIEEKRNDETAQKQAPDDSDNSETSGKVDSGRPPSGRLSRNDKPAKDRTAATANTRKSLAFTSSQRSQHDVEADVSERPSTASTQGDTSTGPSMAEARSLVTESLWTNR